MEGRRGSTEHRSLYRGWFERRTQGRRYDGAGGTWQARPSGARHPSESTTRATSRATAPVRSSATSASWSRRTSVSSMREYEMKTSGIATSMHPLVLVALLYTRSGLPSTPASCSCGSEGLSRSTHARPRLVHRERKPAAHYCDLSRCHMRPRKNWGIQRVHVWGIAGGIQSGQGPRHGASSRTYARLRIRPGEPHQHP